MKHSPAPWSVHPYTGDRCNLHEVPSESGNFQAAEIFIGSGDVLIGGFQHYSPAAGYPSPTFAEMHANARLAIAAPELLEALEAMVAYHTPGHWVDTSGPQYKELNQARAAIAKAKGEA